MASSPDGLSPAANPQDTSNVAYRPVYKHWFHNRTAESKTIWTPFSMTDSMNLEEAYVSKNKEIVTTDGGRYDVNIPERKRIPIYWADEANEVRRCCWFYKGVDSRFTPYTEEVSEQLEEEYRDAANTGEWQRNIPLITGETVVFHGPSIIVHYMPQQPADNWQSASGSQNVSGLRTRVVKRGVDEFSIDDGEPEQVDHLLFMIHGIGSACDLKFRTLEEVVDEFRNISLQLVQSHYRNSCDKGDVSRVEVLPISWHSDLHSEETGIDEKLKSITLESIPKLRAFTNDTLLDVLFYTSPVFCQQIMEAVAARLNNIYTKFCERNPTFKGGVSLAGHSLGSLILFDLLQNQRPVATPNTDEFENQETPDDPSASTKPIKKHQPLKRMCSQQINYNVGKAGTGQPFVTYPQLKFQPKKFFALGSPIGMFSTIRGLDVFGQNFELPTTGNFFNIFHPYDPVAYRIEALVNPDLASVRPVLVPHHKGRKRMHLELRETMARVGADLKDRIFNTFKTTLNTVYNYTTIQKNASDTQAIEQEVEKAIEMAYNGPTESEVAASAANTNISVSSASSEVDVGETNLPLGLLNRGRRIDYVLQEAPLEFFNEYLFALSSHVCYWESEDTILFIVKEIYSSMGAKSDSQIPQQTMTIERPSPATSAALAPSTR